MPVKFDDKSMYEEIGKTIKSYRTKRKFTQKNLADLADLKRTTITNIERGSQNTPLHILYKISLALRVDIRDLIPETEQYVEHHIEPFENIEIGSKSELVKPDLAVVIRKFIDDQ